MDHVIVVDLGFGDAGKGTVVDHLCQAGPAAAVVRFNGGAQAAHNVVAGDGRHHTFAQFGSGTFTPGVRTHLSRFMLVDPLALAAEAAHLRALGVRDALDRLTADRDALLTTPYHRAANRARESARGAARHGSCGMGIGETASYALAHEDAPRAGDCLSPARLRRRLASVRDWYRDAFPDGEDVPDVEDCAAAFTAFAERVRIVGGAHLRRLLRGGTVVFEGAQGVLLDEWHGFHPYTTWSATTFANAETLLAEAGGTALRLGVLRAYATRHGPGPFVTEDPVLTADLPEPHNGTGRWQGAFRAGHLDAVALRYALDAAGGVDGLAVTHLDVAGARPDLRVCLSYEMDGERVGRLETGPPDLDRQAALTERLLRARPVYAPLGEAVETIEDVSGAPVVLRSHGPTAADKTGVPARGARVATSGRPLT
ncbi:adenylosuccinate synthetase [Actinomadura madurae]|uniref:adenylosuccinate synthetase n=1 Tax=Actinomadura madurae TaxID=1993 RepID=UPI0020271A77|nr:adenylosuccinate synthetase [Actinomadura madurae]URN00212.1 adenylosuccinate synthetase [Actinomadura madurae]URN02369.1 adenylosuccinate synthetase [Actinomadura madurae]